MEFIIGVVAIFITRMAVAFGGTMILMSLFVGMPLLKDMKQKGVIVKDAPNKYIVSTIIWCIILFLVEFAILTLLKNYLIYCILGSIWGVFTSFNSLRDRFNPSNVSSFLQLYEDYIIEPTEKGDILTPPLQKNENLKQKANYEIQQMQEQARTDLTNGINRIKAKDMLENEIITPEQYDDIIKNIEMLEMLSSFDFNNIPDNDSKLPSLTDTNKNTDDDEII